MTASVEREGEPEETSSLVSGHVFCLGADWALCSFRLPTSMPIPLAIVSPAEMELSTWAFAGMTAPAYRPICLLLIRTHGVAGAAALSDRPRFVLRTHFCDLAVSTGPAQALDGLSSDDRAVMARAVLSSVNAENVAALAEPIRLLAPALPAVPTPKDAPDLTFGNDGADSCSVSGTDVPNFILFDAGSELRCARVASAHLILSPKSRMDLDLEPVWGRETGPVRRTILISDGRFTVARFGMAGA